VTAFPGHAAPPVGTLLDLTGRVVVVTGVSGGIGQGIARRLGEAGASVVLHVRRDRAAAEVLAAELGDRAVVVAGDLLQDGIAGDLAALAEEHFGGLDGWVNNAGVQPVRALTEMTDDEFDGVLAANAATTFRGTRAAAQRMAQGGAIVNVASIEALQPAVGHSHYVASKAAVVAHTRAAAVELAPSGIRVNAVAPGLIDRPGLDDAWPDGVARWLAACPLGRLGRPDDVADACLFLLSAASRWVTGAVLVVDGGVLARSTW
jgi:NAD(P)-dependent dehydrogenase (short-subunit alcohol dehydrogenase family)